MKTKFLHSQKEAGNAISYYFNPPEDNFMWEAGQYIALSFKENDDSHDNKHWFTIASAPETGVIQVTTRNTNSNYKTRLNNLLENDELHITRAEGAFLWKDSYSSKVFIAGGIGITPFHSILESRYLNKNDSDVHLVYINRDDAYVFKDKLDNFQRAMPSLKISYLIGQITIDLINGVVPNINQSLVYLSGPETMVEGIGNDFLATGLNESQLVRDWFPGYDSNNF